MVVYHFPHQQAWNISKPSYFVITSSLWNLHTEPLKGSSIELWGSKRNLLRFHIHNKGKNLFKARFRTFCLKNEVLKMKHRTVGLFYPASFYLFKIQEASTESAELDWIQQCQQQNMVSKQVHLVIQNTSKIECDMAVTQHKYMTKVNTFLGLCTVYNCNQVHSWKQGFLFWMIKE